MQTEADVQDKKEELAQSLFDHIPVGVGSQGIIPTTAADLEASLEMGMDWSLREVRPPAAWTARRQTRLPVCAVLHAPHTLSTQGRPPAEQGAKQ